MSCNLFTHEVPKSSRNSFKGVRAFQVELEFGNVGFCGGRKTGEPGEKPWEQGREQTQPTYDARSWRRKGLRGGGGGVGSPYKRYPLPCYIPMFTKMVPLSHAQNKKHSETG